MFGLFGSRSRRDQPPPREIREILFGDVPLDEFPLSDKTQTDEPWLSFARAREAVHAGRINEATEIWHHISEMKDLESRHYAQAWHFLRAHGVEPPRDLAKVLLGVVIEVPMEGGLDLLAAYPDHHARYFNFNGGGVVWEHPDDSLDPLIDQLLAAGAQVLREIGPWTQKRPGPPPVGYVRLNLLSPAGLHFGQGPFDTFAADPRAKPVIDAAYALMLKLTEWGKASGTRPTG